MKFCIDPGHGGHDPGAVGPTFLKESAVVLEISKVLANELASFGHEIKLTRTTEVYIHLDDRCDISNEMPADYFISVHCNSNGPSAHGIETLYKSQKGKELALPIQHYLVNMTGEHDRGLKKRDDLYVLNGTNCPAVLAEVGFISNPETEEQLRDYDYQVLLAQAICAGVNKFLGGTQPVPAPEPAPLK